MSIRVVQRKNGKKSYQANIEYNGKTKSKTFRKRKDAGDHEKLKNGEIVDSTYFPHRLKQVPFEELFKDWYKNYAERKKAHSSLVRDKQMYRDYLKPYVGNNTPSQIQSDDVDKIILTLQKETKLSNKSINNILSLLRTIMNYGIKKKFNKLNPVSDVEFLEVVKKDIAYWDKEEAKKFLNYTSEKYKKHRSPYLIYLVALTTGLRMGEIIALTFNDINFENKVVLVNKTFDNTTYKIKVGTKNKKPRHVRINNKLYSELIKQQKLGNEIICNNLNNSYYNEGNINRRYKKDIKEADVKKIRFHDLRKTFGSLHVQEHGNIFELQKILGHSDPRLTFETYADMSPKYIAEKSKVINL